MTCPNLITPAFLHRRANALNCEPMQASTKCRLKTPEHWKQNDPRASRWLLSGGSPLVLGDCCLNACPIAWKDAAT